METEESASDMVKYFNKEVVSLTDQAIDVQLSTLKELKKSQPRDNTILSSQTLLKAVQAQSKIEADGKHRRLCGDRNSQKSHDTQANEDNQSINCQKNEEPGASHNILKVNVEHMVYPVTLDILYEVFSRAGKVQKIATFEKNNTFQALVQYQTVIAANIAKLTLDGNSLFNGSCILRIDNSNLTTLAIKNNSEKCRDYTCPTLAIE